MRPVALFLTIVAISLSSCGGQPPTPTTANSTPALNYTETEGGAAEQVEEVIRMNNCGGRGEVKQTAERSLTVEVEGEASLGVDIRVVRADLAGRYAESRGVSKSMEITAPPGTNMEYTLVWTEQSWFGTVTSSVGSGAAKYRARVPIAVDLRSSRDVGDCAGGQAPTAPATQPEVPPLTPEPPTPPAPPTAIPTTPPPTPIPPTEAGAILRDGETWYGNGWTLTVNNFSYDNLKPTFRLQNNSGRVVLLPSARGDNFTMEADTGESYAPCIKVDNWTWRIPTMPQKEYLAGATYEWSWGFAYSLKGNPCQEPFGRFGDTTRSLTLTVKDIAGVIVNARWQADVPRP